MLLRVKLFSIFRLQYKDYDAEKGIELEMTPGSRLTDLLERLQIEMRKVSMVRVNGRINRDLLLTLQEGDVLEIYPLFGGG